ncbi:unnamed protein product [Didymodactylos carnosus]|uniref:Deacetylase sirtuin-type domain-containing protein n=1 Tax=Didymodactylos carnosus TaxID=1234261 RepID=A0A8S2J909_9BILA|nr:unnamed protein product [Didymodactylos carnosus]CAF3798648.1 unnamed protein product [Didymodactylos carnosus]
MGVSSGFGTFQGIAASVWLPLLQPSKLDYTDIVNPSWFHKPQGNSSNHDTANFAYAFWSDRYNAYTSTAPHLGYFICKQWSELSHIKSAFSFTSNIDGHWIKSGWNESSVLECHGSIHYMQCVNDCRKRIWATKNELKLTVDPKTNCVTDPLPLCSDCNGLARPNVLMFDDWAKFSGNRHDESFCHYGQFKSDIAAAKTKLLVIELGAGTTVPSVRIESELAFTDKRWTAHLIRINPLAEHAVIDAYRNKSKGQALELPLDALTALTLIDREVKKKLK